MISRDGGDHDATEELPGQAAEEFHERDRGSAAGSRNDVGIVPLRGRLLLFTRLFPRGRDERAHPDRRYYLSCRHSAFREEVVFVSQLTVLTKQRVTPQSFERRRPIAHDDEEFRIDSSKPSERFSYYHYFDPKGFEASSSTLTYCFTRLEGWDVALIVV